ncbi:MAG: hypothetical protein HQL56_18920 [Magnetococcales bacterium]|nr:hypothetical protein [Magnetococcales bacterium]
MAQPDPRTNLSEAVDFFNTVLRKLLVIDGAQHPETLIASAARMAGTMALRSLLPADSTFAPGDSVQLEEADEFGARMEAILNSALNALGHTLDYDAIAREQAPLELSRMNLAQTREHLDPVYLNYCRLSPLTFETAALASAFVTGILIHDCRELLPLNRGVLLALAAMVESIRTAPRPVDTTTPDS